MRSVRWVAIVVVFVALVAAPSLALAFPEPNPGTGGGAQCTACHNDFHNFGGDCRTCHGDIDEDPLPGGDAVGFEFGNPWGPHGGYTSATSKCEICHDLHDATGTNDLLPAATVVDTCQLCHDGTGGFGVYGAIAARSQEVKGGHDIGIETTVPGGDATTGGSRVVDFLGPGDTMICTDCHSPHGSNVVTAFLGDRYRMRRHSYVVSSTHLLKRQPTGSATSTTEYGSDWCAGCHAGRMNCGPLHNHPVDSVETTTGTPFVYRNVALVNYFDGTATVLGSLGGISYDSGHRPAGYPLRNPPDISGNRGYLMVYPRTQGATGQAGHAPICQQCHEDSRSVGDLSADGLTANFADAGVDNADGVYWDGAAWVPDTDPSYGNPQFQNFPHETLNLNMLVENEDDLCLNCHPPEKLP